MAKQFISQLKHTLRPQAEESIRTLPALLLRAERAVNNVFQGEHAQRRAGAGEKFWQFRDYQAQDRPQDIDWRQSGKTDRVFIRQKERQLPQTAMVWCCAAESMDFTSSKNHPSKAEAAKIITLALALLMARAGERVGWLGSPQAGRSEHAIETIGEALLAEEDKHDLPHVAPARGQKNAMMILAGDFLSPLPETEMALRSLVPVAGGGFVVQVLDPAEIELPWQGRAIFRDAGGLFNEPVANISSIRDAYRERIQSHLESIKNIARKNHWHYSLHRTDDPLEKTLMNIWKELSGRI